MFLNSMSDIKTEKPIFVSRKNRIALAPLRFAMLPPGSRGRRCCLRQLKKRITLLSFTFDSHASRNLRFQKKIEKKFQQFFYVFEQYE